ncbi:MAG TPA: hypothetical protein VMI10_02410 [Terriglobales bacterium]|nr:hypothetical protein [Terriglobales bacterium]
MSVVAVKLLLSVEKSLNHKGHEGSLRFLRFVAAEHRITRETVT